MQNALKKISQIGIWHGNISAEPLTGGLSNEGYIVNDDSGKFVVRFCHDIPVHHVERGHEAMVSRACHKAGFSPELIHAAPGVMVFAFITAKTYDKDDIAPNLDRLVARIHALHEQVPHHLSGPARLFNVFHYVRDYARTLVAGNSPHTAQTENFLTVSAALEAVQTPLPIVFTHNDFLPANFLDDGEKIWIIDFEYAAYGTAMFDLANLAANARFSPDEDDRLLALYFGNRVTPDLKQSLAAMKVASALRELMWSMVSQLHLNAPGVNYGDYVAECTPAYLEELDTYQTSYGKIV